MLPFVGTVKKELARGRAPFYYLELGKAWQAKRRQFVDVAREQCRGSEFLPLARRRALEENVDLDKLGRTDEMRFGWRSPLSPVGLHISLGPSFRPVLNKQIAFKLLDPTRFRVYAIRKPLYRSGFSQRQHHTIPLLWVVWPVHLEGVRETHHISIAVYVLENVKE